MTRQRATDRRWRRTLGAGAVVLVAVAGLLETLRRTVGEVDAAVQGVWTAGKKLAQQTQAAHLLETTERRTRSLHEEIGAAASAPQPGGTAAGGSAVGGAWDSHVTEEPT